MLIGRHRQAAAELARCSPAVMVASFGTNFDFVAGKRTRPPASVKITECSFFSFVSILNFSFFVQKKQIYNNLLIY